MSGCSFGYALASYMLGDATEVRTWELCNAIGSDDPCVVPNL